MRAKQVKQKPEFVPVIVTLESQEEVDAIFAVGNDVRVCYALPALEGVYKALKSFTSEHYENSCDKLDRILN